MSTIAKQSTSFGTTARPCVPALEDILGQELPVLDAGFVRVVDYMGNDDAIVQAARVSYGTGTKMLNDEPVTAENSGLSKRGWEELQRSIAPESDSRDTSSTDSD